MSTKGNQNATKERRALPEKTMTARQEAKMFGGKALAGSRKQVDWAEKIRAEKIAGMQEVDAIMACRPNGLGRFAQFWIQNRSRSPSEFSEFFREQAKLISICSKLKEEGQDYSLLAAKYNALTLEWGFK